MKKTYTKDERGFTINKHFWSVEKGNVLIKLNKITGEATVCGPGAHFLTPGIVVGKEKKITDKNESFVDIVCKSKDDYELTLDVDIITNVTDAIKCEFASHNSDDILLSLLESLFRRFVSSKTYQELSKMKFDINDKSLSWMRDSLNDFEANYGIRISKVILKKVRLPKELEDDFQKRIIQERENERKQAEALGNRAIAGIKAETAKIEKQAENEIVEDFINRLRAAGISMEDMKDVLVSRILSDSNNNVTHIIGGNNAINQVAATASTLDDDSKSRTK